MPAFDQAKLGGVREQLVAGRDVYPVLVEGDTAKSTITASTQPVDIRLIPVQEALRGLFLQVQKKNATVAFATVGFSSNSAG